MAVFPLVDAYFVAITAQEIRVIVHSSGNPTKIASQHFTEAI
jgi:hypothetical protein